MYCMVQRGGTEGTNYPPTKVRRTVSQGEEQGVRLCMCVCEREREREKEREKERERERESVRECERV